MALSVAALVVLAAACSGDRPTPPTQAEGTVGFQATDGVALRGRLFGDGDIAVALAHMYPADQASWAPFAETLAGEGYTAFTFNFRGYPPSGGEKEIPLIDADLEGAVRFLEQRGAAGVFLVGASMGGTEAVKVAARRPVLGVVAVSAPTEFRGLSALGDMARVSAPTLFMAAEDDRGAQVAASTLFDEARQPRLLEVFTGDEHGTDLLYGRFSGQVQERIRAFLAAYTP